jgi:hypothetical protein
MAFEPATGFVEARAAIRNGQTSAPLTVHQPIVFTKGEQIRVAEADAAHGDATRVGGVGVAGLDLVPG